MNEFLYVRLLLLGKPKYVRLLLLGFDSFSIFYIALKCLTVPSILQTHLLTRVLNLHLLRLHLLLRDADYVVLFAGLFYLNA